MYLKFFQKNNINYEIINIEENQYGLQNASIKVFSPKKLKNKLLNESGNHRFIRKSPFSKQNKLHTSFVSVSTEIVEDLKSNLTVKDADLTIQFFKGSGAGGQHRNKVETGVRLIHNPTGMVSEAVSERSQKQNRTIAYKKLLEKLNETLINNVKIDEKNKWSNKSNAGFGEKRRSYRLEESIIKDELSNLQFKNINKILSGDILELLTD